MYQNINQESGRSMVEMLGVLAIIGVLSVAGIAGYKNAMTKYKANELLNEASKRAVVVAGQVLAGKTGDIPLSEFPTAVSGATFADSATVENGKIKIGLSGVDQDVCQQMKAAAGDNSVLLIPEDCTDNASLTLTFNQDMSKGSAGSGEHTVDGWTGDEPGAVCDPNTKPTVEDGQTPCSVCLKTGDDTAEWFGSDALCGDGSVCTYGVCSDVTDGYEEGYYCSKNSDCINNSNYSDQTGLFCYYYYGVPPNGKGYCYKPTEHIKSFPSGSTAEEEGYMLVNVTDFESAQNLCRLFNKNVASIDTLGVDVPFPCYGAEACNVTEEQMKSLFTKFGETQFYLRNPHDAHRYSEVSIYRTDIGGNDTEYGGGGNYLCK